MFKIAGACFVHMAPVAPSRPDEDVAQDVAAASWLAHCRLVPARLPAIFAAVHVVDVTGHPTGSFHCPVVNTGGSVAGSSQAGSVGPPRTVSAPNHAPTTLLQRWPLLFCVVQPLAAIHGRFSGGGGR